LCSYSKYKVVIKCTINKPMIISTNDSKCRGNAAILFIIYKDCFMGTCICRQCAINSIRTGVRARRRRILHNVCDTFEGSVGRS